MYTFLLVLGLVLSLNAGAQTQQVRKNCRQSIIDSAPISSNKSGIKENDKIELLVDVPSQLIRNIQIMDEKKLNSGSLEIKPWSDSYWPIYLGSLGNRYNDPGFYFSDWKEAFDYVTQNPASKLIKEKLFDHLSPSEKYDYLFKMPTNGLTQSNWAEGRNYFDENGSVETWMGLCHGWSAASIMMPEPKKAVRVQVANDELTFYPSDIKSLATLLWAKGEFNTRFIGGRCNQKDPQTDSMNRPLNQDCLDNNPGTWHMAIVNQIGQFKRSFVMDATYDQEVWNQPISAYSIKYYNPLTKREVAKLNEAIVNRSEFRVDPRAKVRAPNSTKIVGVKMTVQYVAENSPSSEENQATVFRSVQYEYDLELDTNGNIVGGEWYSDNHPDFLWIPEKNVFPATYGDQPHSLIELAGINSEVIRLAKINAKYELPYGAIVRTLVELSK